MGSYTPGKSLSLLTTIGNVYKDYALNIISGLSMVSHKAIRAYCFIPNSLVSSAPEPRHLVLKCASFVTSHTEALTFTGHRPQNIA